MNLKIKTVIAREILDSRGTPTLETSIELNDGTIAKASVPSGASTGRHEALELRDGDKSRYYGQGVQNAITNVNDFLGKKIKSFVLKNIQDLDKFMIGLDGTSNKSKLGANAILSISLAATRALAISEGLNLYQYLRRHFFKQIKTWKMPRCMMNVVNGGVHANWSTDIQEYMIIPCQNTAKESVRCGAEIFWALKNFLKKNNLSTAVGDEGGFAPLAKNNSEPLEWISQAVKNSGYSLGKDVTFGLDVASSSFYSDAKYVLRVEKERKNAEEMFFWYNDLMKKYPIESIEDGLAEDDWSSWKKMTSTIGKNIKIIGDDLFVTNIERLEKGIKENSANGILIKLNQIGSVSETIKAIQLARENDFVVAISHRSGETLDDFIADLAVASSADYLKAGSLSRGERVAKYNRLMEIEQKITK